MLWFGWWCCGFLVLLVCLLWDVVWFCWVLGWLVLYWYWWLFRLCCNCFSWVLVIGLLCVLLVWCNCVCLVVCYCFWWLVVSLGNVFVREVRSWWYVVGDSCCSWVSVVLCWDCVGCVLLVYWFCVCVIGWCNGNWNVC